MKKHSGIGGMSLLELIIALAILGIITTVFLSSFTGGFTTILGMGHKTAAMAEAQTLMDKVYEAGAFDASVLTDGGAVNVAFNVAYAPASRIRYANTTQAVAGVTMTQVDLLVFYNNGNNAVKLTALIP